MDFSFSYLLAYLLLFAYLLVALHTMIVLLSDAPPFVITLISNIVGAITGLVCVVIQTAYAVIRFFSPPPQHPAWLLYIYPVWLLDMAKVVTASENRSEPNLSAFRHLLSCNNDECRKKKPLLCCSRCQFAYYCSEDCQQKHWLQGHCEACAVAVKQQAKWQEDLSEIEDGAMDDTDTTDETLETADTTCGICLDSPIRHPFVLSNCQHVFCFVCIRQYQESKNAPLVRNNKGCSFCRATIDGNVTDEALKKAQMKLKRVEMLLDDDDIVGRHDACQEALLEIDKVLDANSSNVAVLLLRADLLKHADPLEAVQLYKTMGLLTRARFRPEQNIKLSMGIAQLFEAAGLYPEALAEYRRVHTGGAKPMSVETMSELTLGMSRCYFHMGMFKEAIASAEYYVVQERHVAGGHKIVAMALLAMAEEAKTSGVAETKCTGKKFSATLEGAVEIMHKGLVYEAPWNDKNKRANLKFLKELLKKVNFHGIANKGEASGIRHCRPKGDRRG